MRHPIIIIADRLLWQMCWRLLIFLFLSVSITFSSPHVQIHFLHPSTILPSFVHAFIGCESSIHPSRESLISLLQCPLHVDLISFPGFSHHASLPASTPLIIIFYSHLFCCSVISLDWSFHSTCIFSPLSFIGERNHSPWSYLCPFIDLFPFTSSEVNTVSFSHFSSSFYICVQFTFHCFYLLPMFPSAEHHFLFFTVFQAANPFFSFLNNHSIFILTLFLS